MSHAVAETESKPKIEKASLLQALAVKESEEVQTLHQAQAKAKQIVEEAREKAQARLDRVETELSTLEKEILDREVAKGKEIAAQIRSQAEKTLSESVSVWGKRVDQAAQNLARKILEA